VTAAACACTPSALRDACSSQRSAASRAFSRRELRNARSASFAVSAVSGWLSKMPSTLAMFLAHPPASKSAAERCERNTGSSGAAAISAV
jgi:hypothetical protein